jgi:hypothetical protein
LRQLVESCQALNIDHGHVVYLLRPQSWLRTARLL